MELPLGNASFPQSVRAAALKMQLDSDAALVVASLRRASVRAILLKGPSLARWLYADGAPRHYVDCDLLVSPPQLPAAGSVLASLGYASAQQGIVDLPGDRPTYVQAWKHPESGTRIEVHRTLIGVGVSPAELWNVLSQETELMRLQNIEVDTLNARARTLHVALHAAQDGGRSGRAMEDLRRAIALVPLDTWMEAKDLAHRLQAVAAFAHGLRLDPEGRRLAESLDLGDEKSVGVLLQAGWSVPSARSIEWLASTPGLVPKIRLVGHKLFPPPQFMRVWSPVARRGAAGLVVAYAWRPLWVMGTAVPGFVEWTRARRRARGNQSQR